MSTDTGRRQELANKFPEMNERFQAVKSEMDEPHVQRLGETAKEQKKQGNNLS